jgi:hypothetical protein
MPKPNKASSSHYHSLDVQCANLKLTEIIYKDDDARQLVELLIRISENLPIDGVLSPRCSSPVGIARIDR